MANTWNPKHEHWWMYKWKQILTNTVVSRRDSLYPCSYLCLFFLLLWLTVTFHNHFYIDTITCFFRVMTNKLVACVLFTRQAILDVVSWMTTHVVEQLENNMQSCHGQNGDEASNMKPFSDMRGIQKPNCQHCNIFGIEQGVIQQIPKPRMTFLQVQKTKYHYITTDNVKGLFKTEIIFVKPCFLAHEPDWYDDPVHSHRDEHKGLEGRREEAQTKNTCPDLAGPPYEVEGNGSDLHDGLLLPGEPEWAVIRQQRHSQWQPGRHQRAQPEWHCNKEGGRVA